MVSTAPAGETFDSTAAPTQMNPTYPAAARIDDPRRPVPPADIPEARPLDLQASRPSHRRQYGNTQRGPEDMLSAAKSVFHAVLPK